MRVAIALEVRCCPGQRFCIVYLCRLLVVGSHRGALRKMPQPHCIELKSISNPVLTSEGCEPLTDRIACDMLHRKFEHCGIKEYDSLNDENSRTQSVTPGFLAAAENVVECVTIIRSDAVRHGGSSQTLKYALIVDSDTQNAVVGTFSRFF
jgi:hypothetical protein